MKVPFFDYERVFASERNYLSKRIEEVLVRSDFILRGDLVTFESNLAKFCNSNFMIGVGNGTDAIWLSLEALGIGRGDEVILPSHTYVATADAVRFVGAIPVLVDCGPDHSISIDAIAEAMSPRTSAVIPVNLNGRACELDEIVKLADKQGIVVIEDNAQGLGAKLNGKSTGTFGKAGTLSFFPAKNLGCYGDGGGILVQDTEVASKLKRLRNHGRDEQGEVQEWGYNSRLDNLQAAILDEKLKFFEQAISRRREIAAIYQARLGELESLKLPPAPDSNVSYFDSYQNYEVEAEQRDLLVAFLKARGIGTSLPWAGKAVHHFNLSNCVLRDLSYTESLFKKVLLLPMNQYMTNEEVEYVASSIREFYSNSASGV